MPWASTFRRTPVVKKAGKTVVSLSPFFGKSANRSFLHIFKDGSKRFRRANIAFRDGAKNKDPAAGFQDRGDRPVRAGAVRDMLERGRTHDQVGIAIARKGAQVGGNRPVTNPRRRQRHLLRADVEADDCQPQPLFRFERNERLEPPPTS